MVAPRLVLCNSGTLPEGAPAPEKAVTLELRTLGPDSNVHLTVEDVTDRFGRELPARVVDLLEIAAFVYSADCAVSRGKGWSDRKSTEPWSRDFTVVLPVRDLYFWRDESVSGSLQAVLQFMTDDTWRFVFVPVVEAPPVQQYLEYADVHWPFEQAERVIMFSGGIDSLAGAVESAARGDKCVLVSHRPVSTMDSRQKTLFDGLRGRYADKLFRIPVWVNKSRLDAEPTQRSRSFLFGSLGAAVASALGAPEVTFYENGVVSLNLPVADEVVRARASRTTHPMSLQMMSELFSRLLDREITLGNPFIFMTKTDVVRSIIDNGAGDLIGHSCSCAHAFYKSKQQAHCGTCSQCIDRRIAMVAAGAEAYDSTEDYAVDVFTGPRKDGYQRSIAVDYARHAVALSTMSSEEMARRFNLELSRATRPFAPRREAAERMVDMHARHGKAAYGAIETEIQRHASELVGGSLPESSMLRLVAGGLHRKESWVAYAERLVGILTEGLPRAFQHERPDNEKRLQEISDALLVAAGETLNREYPFLRWGSVLTKPDWSDQGHELLFEAKYVKQKDAIRRITEEIAADITKYGDSASHVLFVIYDPGHYILDVEAQIGVIEGHDRMIARVLQ